MAKTEKFVVNKVTSEASPRLKHGQTTYMQCLEWVLSQLNRLLIGFITIYVCWVCLRQRPADIPWHACLCTIGFTCLMAEGLMAHYRGNLITQICQRPEKTRMHWVLQLLGSILGIAGIIVKMDLEEVHFPTLHGQLGLVAFIMCVISLGSGLCSLYATELKDHLRPVLNKSTHILLGLITFTFAMLSTLLSFDTELFLDYSLDAANYFDFRLVLKAVTIAIWILSSYGAFWNLIQSKLWECCRVPGRQ